MVELGKHLHYQWIFVSPLFGSVQHRGNWVSVRYQLAVVYSPAPTIRLHRVADDWAPGQRMTDVIPAGEREKSLHPHRENRLPDAVFD